MITSKILVVDDDEHLLSLLEDVLEDIVGEILDEYDLKRNNDDNCHN